MARFDESEMKRRLEDFTTTDKTFPFELMDKQLIVSSNGDKISLSSLFSTPIDKPSIDFRPTLLMFGRNLL